MRRQGQAGVSLLMGRGSRGRAVGGAAGQRNAGADAGGRGADDRVGAEHRRPVIELAKAGLAVDRACRAVCAAVIGRMLGKATAGVGGQFVGLDPGQGGEIVSDLSPQGWA